MIAIRERPVSEPTAKAEIQQGADDVLSGRDRLLEAAASEFCECGYSGCSIAAIARRAGISKSTIFHHFDSKESLYLAVIAGAVAEFGQTMDYLLKHEVEPANALASFQQTHMRHLYRNRQVARLVLRELQHETPSDRAIRHVIDAISENFRRLRQYLDSAIGQGRIRADADTEVAALLMFAANVFFFQNEDALSKLQGLDPELDSERFACSVADLIVRGLQPPGKEQ